MRIDKELILFAFIMIVLVVLPCSALLYEKQKAESMVTVQLVLDEETFKRNLKYIEELNKGETHGK